MSPNSRLRFLYLVREVVGRVRTLAVCRSARLRLPAAITRETKRILRAGQRAAHYLDMRATHRNVRHHEGDSGKLIRTPIPLRSAGSLYVMSGQTNCLFLQLRTTLSSEVAQT